MNKNIDYLEIIEMCVTSKCNLECKHCYQHYEKNSYELSLDKIIDFIIVHLEKLIGELIKKKHDLKNQNESLNNSLWFFSII